MKTNPPTVESGLPFHDTGEPSSYSLEILAEITGISSTTILHYQEQGLIRRESYDDESVHTLRRIEHLKATCETNLSGLKLIINLMDEVERLKTELRTRR